MLKKIIIVIVLLFLITFFFWKKSNKEEDIIPVQQTEKFSEKKVDSVKSFNLSPGNSRERREKLEEKENLEIFPEEAGADEFLGESSYYDNSEAADPDLVDDVDAARVLRVKPVNPIVNQDPIYQGEDEKIEEDRRLLNEKDEFDDLENYDDSELDIDSPAYDLLK